RPGSSRLRPTFEILEGRWVPAVFKITSVPSLTLDTTVYPNTDSNGAWGSVPTVGDASSRFAEWTLSAGVSSRGLYWAVFPYRYSGGFTLSGDLTFVIQPENAEPAGTPVDVTLDLSGWVLDVLPNTPTPSIHMKVDVVGRGPVVDLTDPPS